MKLLACLGFEYRKSKALSKAADEAKQAAFIEANNPTKRGIRVIWDNAAYHKGPDVRAFLQRPECRIHLIQLSTYCSHLNPIERLWAVLHEYVTHNKVYETRHDFARAILNFLRDTTLPPPKIGTAFATK